VVCLRVCLHARGLDFIVHFHAYTRERGEQERCGGDQQYALHLASTPFRPGASRNGEPAETAQYSAGSDLKPKEHAVLAQAGAKIALFAKR